MRKYYEEKPLKISSKRRKNNIGQVKKVIKKTDEISQQKKPKRAETTIIEPTKSTATIKHPRERKELIKENIAKKKKNSKSVLLGTFDFDPEEYLDKSHLFVSMRYLKKYSIAIRITLNKCFLNKKRQKNKLKKTKLLNLLKLLIQK